jgi:lipopolysaccharide export system permease protein
MRILDRYLLKSFFIFFLLGLGSIAVLFLVLAVFDNLSRYFASGNVPLSLITLRYLYEEPRIIYMAMPMALLLSASILLGLLDQRHELVVVKATGISLFRLSLPLLLSSVGVALIMLILGNYLVPPANAGIKEIESIMRGEKPASATGAGYIWYVRERKKGGLSVYRIFRSDISRGRLKGFRLYEFSPSLKLTKEIHAASAAYKDKGWILSGVRVWDYRNGPAGAYEQIQEAAITLPEKPEDFTVQEYGPEEMTSKKIRQHLLRIQRYGLDDREFWVELRVRQALPMASIIMALLAIPFALRPKRTSSLILNLLFATVIGFAYFAIMGESISLAKNGTFPPAFGAWIANIIFGMIGILLFSGTRQ